MVKKYVGTGLVALGLLFSVSLAAPAQAASLTSAQVQAVISLLQAFGVDASTIASVNATLSGSAPEQSNCVTLHSNTTLGSSGADVLKLQNYLINSGLLSAKYNTGYYGIMTVQAVGKLQMNLGILSSPDDTSFGWMGPRTRAAIACGSMNTTPINPTPIQQPTPSYSSPLSASCQGTIYNDVVNGVTWAALASGGSGSYTYQWNLPDTSWVNPSLDSMRVQYSSAGTKNASLTVSDGNNSTTANCSVTIAAAPSISSITPNSATANTVVTISGTNLTGASEVDFYNASTNQLQGGIMNGVQNNITVSSDGTSLQFTLSDTFVSNENAGNYQVNVVTPTGTSNALTFSLTSP